VDHSWLIEKNRQSPEKRLFSDFTFLLNNYISRRNFLFPSKFHIFSRSEKSWGDKEYENFRLNDAAGQKMTFFRIFFFCCTSTHRDETFLFLPKFHIFSRLEKSWGDKEYENFRLK